MPAASAVRLIDEGTRRALLCRCAGPQRRRVGAFNRLGDTLSISGIAVGPFRIGFARCLSAARPLAYAPLGLRLPLDVLDLPRKPQAPAVPTGPAAAVAGLRASGRGAWLRRARAQSRYKVRRVDGYRQHEADRREHVGGNARRYARKGSERNNGDNANHVRKRVGKRPDAVFRNSIISFVVRQCHGRNPSGLSCPSPRSR